VSKALPSTANRIVFKTAVIAPTDATVTFIPKPSNVPKLRIALAILVQFTFLPLFKV
jgi:hypothetical protein